ncbi:hypothetical protein [Halalkalibacter alkalisediminis]|uniref:Uncharacterized protein n=1 Tax=Halalkalibacter alkalisediminis TaxID=935616 RepID=A0ABV6NLL3_9BACI|nr:hypothetical protein [Halalkalibacter alkalisediminis]
MSSLDTRFLLEDINETAEYISTILEKSVIIENKNFELIAYSSPDHSHFDSTQQKNILSKKCPVFIIERLEIEGIVQQLETKNDPIRVEPIEEVGLYQRVVISVKHNKQTIGYMGA